MICMRCGTNCADNAKFCLSCGSPLAAAPIPSPTQPIAQPQQYAQPQMPQQPIQPAYRQPVQASYLQQYAQPQYPQQAYSQNYAAAPKVKSKFNIKDPGTILILLSCILLPLACFLTWEKAQVLKYTETVSLMDVKDGWVILIGVAMVLVFLFTNLKIGVYIVSGLLDFYCVLEIFVVQLDFSDSLTKLLVTKEAGYYTLIVGAVILLLGNIILLINHVRFNEKRAIQRRAQMYPHQ